MTATLRREALQLGPHALSGELVLPAGAKALVMFAHGSGSSRLSPRNLQVAEVLQRRGLATLLFDLLSDAEASVRANVFDIALLGRRVEEALDAVAQHTLAAPMRVGLFGASTGAAAALVAAADRVGQVHAVVSRGGRPDLARQHLWQVAAPTLLIVGGNDTEVLAWNRAALRLLTCKRALEVVPHATHLFEEPGALERVAELAANWFDKHLAPPASA